MAPANYTESGGANEWSDEIVAEAINRSCPYCGVQPPENCHGGHPIEFAGPMGHMVKLHAPRLRQVPAYTAPQHH